MYICKETHYPLPALRNFFLKHNYHPNSLYGIDEWKNTGSIFFSDWGIYDDELFEKAKVKIKQLHDSGQKFSLTILSGDTHEPVGYLSPYCRRKGASSLPDIIECSTRSAADFVNFIKENGYMKDTNIVIIGDHLYPRDKIFNGLPKSKRNIFNSFLSEKEPLKNREDIIIFDLYPTILDFIGLKVDGGKLGLGKTGFK